MPRLIAKPKQFQIKVANCGTNTCNATFNVIKDKNPIILSDIVVREIMSKQFCTKEAQPMFLYYLACKILRRIKFDKKNLLGDIEKIDELIKDIVLKEKVDPELEKDSKNG
jgi:hypothetical protein